MAAVTSPCTASFSFGIGPCTGNVRSVILSRRFLIHKRTHVHSPPSIECSNRYEVLVHANEDATSVQSPQPLKKLPKYNGFHKYDMEIKDLWEIIGLLKAEVIDLRAKINFLSNNSGHHEHFHASLNTQEHTNRPCTKEHSTVAPLPLGTCDGYSTIADSKPQTVKRSQSFHNKLNTRPFDVLALSHPINHQPNL